MSEEVKSHDPLSAEFDDKGRGVLKSIYDFLSSLIAGSIGIVTFVACIFTTFRHGGGLADISIIELGLFIWVIYCFSELKNLALEQKRSILLFYWRLFALTGWMMFWTCLTYKAWFKWGADAGYYESFLASNLFEISLLLVVGIGSGLGVLTNLDFDEEKQTNAEENGETK
jgi:hypothetical protein